MNSIFSLSLLRRGSLYKVIWQGTIDSISAAYKVDGKNRINLVAFDGLKSLFSTRIAELDTQNTDGFVTPYQQLELIAEQFGTVMNEASLESAGKIPSTFAADVIPTKYIYEAIQIGLGLFWIDPATKEFVFVPRPDPAIVPDFPVGAGYFTLAISLLGGEDVLGNGRPVYTIGNKHGTRFHLCMSDISTVYDSDIVSNSLRVELESNAATYVLTENQDSIQLYGKYAQDVTLNTTDQTELRRWANEVFNQTPAALVRSVETPAIDRLGNLTGAAFLLPGELLGVDFEKDIVKIKEFYTITKVSHYIDPNNWLTTLDTWKGA